LIIDIIVAIMLLIAIWVGYQQGVVKPLLVEIFFLLALVIIVRDRAAYQAAMQHYLHANTILAVFLALVVAVVAGFVGGQIGGLIHRMPVVRGIDGFLGVFVHAAFVVVMVYIALSALVTLDKAFGPTLSAASLTATQVQALSSNLQGNPLTSMLVDPNDLKRLHLQTAKPGGSAHIETVPQLDQLQTFYEQFLQPQLASSRTAPFIMRIGQKIPIVGHAGPDDLPKAASAPRLSPTPTPSPTKK
jgi:uncharacterized membrane protein required for colicin V production